VQGVSVLRSRQTLRVDGGVESLSHKQHPYPHTLVVRIWVEDISLRYWGLGLRFDGLGFRVVYT
jgi:hypothetical protein